MTAFFLVGLVAACHTRPRSPQHQEAIARQRSHGRCPASGIHANGTCPKIEVPAVNASSDEGCKLDSGCGDDDEKHPRCVENPSYDPPTPRGQARGRSNLLGAQPRPPPPTECVYDACHIDADCPKGFGCECGSGEGFDRNRCIELDACLADADCPTGSRCQCDHSAPNYCMPSNCDSDAECNGSSCVDSPAQRGRPAGRYCRTSRDRCSKSADCTAKQGGYEAQCGYDVAEGLWTCQEVELPPPG